jgi:uncharacterized protein
LDASLHIRDIAEARRFYREVLGCLEEPKEAPWLEFNLSGHPIVCRLDSRLGQQGQVVAHYRLVGGKYVPIAHCRIQLGMGEWRSLAKKLRQHGVKFVIEPYRPIASSPDQQATLLLQDPTGNAIEVQSYCHSAEERALCERQRALARWMPWAILATCILGYLWLQPGTSKGEIVAGNFSAPACPAPSASAGLCAR